MMGLLLARMFDFDIPLDIDTELMPNHWILRHEFQCMLPLDAAEVISHKKTFGEVAVFRTVPTASWQQDLDELIECSKAGSCHIQKQGNKAHLSHQRLFRFYPSPVLQCERRMGHLSTHSATRIYGFHAGNE